MKKIILGIFKLVIAVIVGSIWVGDLLTKWVDQGNIYFFIVAILLCTGVGIVLEKIGK